MKSPTAVGLHVAIIMDGNGRWAEASGLPRLAGHRAGARAVRRTVEAACRLGIGTLTLYAFSSDNWQRPASEVAGLMRLLRAYLRRETPECVRQGIRLSLIGRRDRLPQNVRRAAERAERESAGARRLHLRLAVDYSARGAILEAARRLPADGTVSRQLFARLLCGGAPGEPARDVDLLIRTGGEQRLSDFLLWESAYAELVFMNRMWPDFGAADLEAALDEFRARDRRFGRVRDGGGATKLAVPPLPARRAGPG